MLLNSSSWVWEGKYTRPFSGPWGEESSILILGTRAARELTTVVWFSSHCLQGPSAPSRPLLAPVLQTWMVGRGLGRNTTPHKYLVASCGTSLWRASRMQIWRPMAQWWPRLWWAQPTGNALGSFKGKAFRCQQCNRFKEKHFFFLFKNKPHNRFQDSLTTFL